MTDYQGRPRWLIGPLAVIALAVTVVWLAVVVIAVVNARDMWGWIWAGAGFVAFTATAVVASSLAYRLTEQGIEPLIGADIAWGEITSVSIRGLPLSLSSVRVGLERGRLVAEKDLDLVGTASWAQKAAAELASRAGVEVDLGQEESEHAPGRVADDTTD